LFVACRPSFGLVRFQKLGAPILGAALLVKFLLFFSFPLLRACAASDPANFPNNTSLRFYRSLSFPPAFPRACPSSILRSFVQSGNWRVGESTLLRVKWQRPQECMAINQRYRQQIQHVDQRGKTPSNMGRTRGTPLQLQLKSIYTKLLSVRHCRDSESRTLV
jgi:hypothetical protein